mgnify:CR=1 FL=1
MGYESFIPLAMNVLGTALQSGGEKQAGRDEKAAADFQAAQLRVNAGQAVAASQIDAANETRKSKLLQSRALALAAASGGGAVDPSVMKIISGLAGEGKLASLTQLYAGDERARAMNSQAAATEYEGVLKKKAYDTKARGTILSGAKSIYDTLGPAFSSGGGRTGDTSGYETSPGVMYDSSFNEGYG